jgi:magnesium-transporting ATPase (P-type)
MFAAKSGFFKSSVVASREDVETQDEGIRYTHVSEHPFDSNVKRMTVIYREIKKDINIAFMKGAPERVLDACEYDAEGAVLTDTAKDDVLRLMDRFASEGLVEFRLTVLIVASPCFGIKNFERRRHSSRSS